MFNLVPSALVHMASQFGIISSEKALLINGLQNAPAPIQRELSGDWLKNLDVIAGAAGCLVAGYFDALVAPYGQEDIDELDPAPLITKLGVPAWLQSLLFDTFETCVQARKEYGPLGAAITAGKFSPDGLIAHAVVKPFQRNNVANATTRGDGLLARKSQLENDRDLANNRDI